MTEGSYLPLHEGRRNSTWTQALCAPLGITQLVDQDKSYGDIVADQEYAIAALRNRERPTGK